MRKGKVIPYRGTEDRKGAGTNSEKSGMRDLEAESIRSKAESTGGCVKLKTVTSYHALPIHSLTSRRELWSPRPTSPDCCWHVPTMRR